MNDPEWFSRLTVNEQRKEQLARMPYAEYLRTPEWAEKRKQTLIRDDHRCRLCYSNEKLEVHHRTYQRRGREDLNDLTTLCESCHEHFHSKVEQSDLMDKTGHALYPDPTVVRKNKKVTVQTWEDLLVGLLLEATSLTSHVCGIIAPDDFTREDTRMLYQLLLAFTAQKPVPNQSLDVPPELHPAVLRCREEAMYILSRDEVTQARSVVQAASRLKRMQLQHVSEELRKQAPVTNEDDTPPWDMPESEQEA